MKSPYENRPRKSFWKSGVAEQTISTISELYKPKFNIDQTTRIATLGSCFAQHIGRNMRARGYRIIDVEPPPPGLIGNEAESFGYNLFSARVGNIYVVRHLLQLFEEAFGGRVPKQAVWRRDNRFFDALRPSVEPYGLESVEQVLCHRARHIEAVQKMFLEAEVLIFTLGLTESWVHKKTGTVYPTAPGTVAGVYDPEEYVFKNFTFSEILKDFKTFMSRIIEVNPKIKFLLTVSPVPLTATATNDHILVATTYSKSLLRAVAGQLYTEINNIDYFPSYDLITSTFSRGEFYSSNLRSISPHGVEKVMDIFFSAYEHEPLKEDISVVTKTEKNQSPEDDILCDDLLLEAFGK